MKILRYGILFATLAVFLYLINTGILGAENNLKNGRLAYFRLAPVDPRSLIQGDYMVLDYAIERDANERGLMTSHRGKLVLKIDARGITTFNRLYTGESLAEDEVLVNFWAYGGGVRMDTVTIGVDSFFFQEGRAESYANAVYAEVRLLEDGTMMLVDLVGEELQELTGVPSS